VTKVGVFVAGSWGTALAAHLARNGHDVRLWGRDRAQIQTLAATRRNDRYLPGIELPATLSFSAELETMVGQTEHWLIAVPSHAFAGLAAQLGALGRPRAGLSWATKGFEPGSGRFLHEVAEQHLYGVAHAVITGPSFAKEVAAGLPCALTVHGSDEAHATWVARLLHGPQLRAYSGTDLRGAELGGAMKNVLAVATGIADGMGLGHNARAGLITRGLNEMLRLNLALGGRAETLIGLAGVGDLVLTCTGDLSRNRRLGLALGRKTPLKQALAEIGQVVESVQTADEVMRLAERHRVELPICARVRAVLHEDITPAEGLESLLAREQKPEYPDGLLR
jgi:glycerol-3-phosphate dehydrogenase (NAD(P)+)